MQFLINFLIFTSLALQVSQRALASQLARSFIHEQNEQDSPTNRVREANKRVRAQ